MKKFNIVIAGGGIAGLASAEIFARSGYKVLLLEKNPKLCMEASGSHQKWFHFGSLYSVFSSPRFFQAMLKNIQYLLKYYQGFEGMNLVINREGNPYIEMRENSWFQAQHLIYLLTSTRHPDFFPKKASYLLEYIPKLHQRLFWKYIITKQFLVRHYNLYKYNWSSQKSLNDLLKVEWLQQICLPEVNFSYEQTNLNYDFFQSIKSYDCPMNTENILSDLLCSFLSHDGELWLNATYETYQCKSNKKLIITRNREIVETEKLILAIGRNLNRYLKSSVKLCTVASPLLVVYPPVCSENFVKLTPFVSKTINHIKHNYNGIPYSLIGNGYSSTVEKLKMEEVKKSLYDNAIGTFSGIDSAEISEIYFGYKTEVSKSSKNRGYDSCIKLIDRNVLGVIPGKFSLGFSLAVDIFKIITDKQPSLKIHYSSNSSAKSLISETKHEAIINQYFQQKK